MEGRKVNKGDVRGDDYIVGLVLARVQVEVEEWGGIWVIGLAGVVEKMQGVIPGFGVEIRVKAVRGKASMMFHE